MTENIDFQTHYTDILSGYRGNKKRLINVIRQLHDGGDPLSAPTLEELESMADQIDSMGPSTLSKGLQSGWHQTVGSLSGAVGLAADAVGVESVRDWGYEGYQDRMEQAAEVAPPVQDVRDVHSWSDAADWFLGTVGQLAPSVAEIALSAVVGAGVTGVGARKLAKESIEKAVKAEIRDQIAKGQVQKNARKYAEKKVMDQIKLRGRQLGVTLGGGALEGGSMYGEAADAVGIENVDPLVAGGLGLVSGATELLGPEGKLLTRGWLKGKGHYGARLARRMAQDIPEESFQEGLQHGIAEANMHLQDPGHETDPGSFANAMAAGAVGGGLFGAVGAIPRETAGGTIETGGEPKQIGWTPQLPPPAEHTPWGLGAGELVPEMGTPVDGGAGPSGPPPLAELTPEEQAEENAALTQPGPAPGLAQFQNIVSPLDAPQPPATASAQPTLPPGPMLIPPAKPRTTPQEAPQPVGLPTQPPASPEPELSDLEKADLALMEPEEQEAYRNARRAGKSHVEALVEVFPGEAEAILGTAQKGQEGSLSYDETNEGRYHGTAVVINEKKNAKGQVTQKAKKGIVHQTRQSTTGELLVEVQPEGGTSTFRMPASEITVTKLVDNGPAERKPEVPVEKETPQPKRKTVHEIADELAAEGVDPQASYAQYVKEMNLKPEIDNAEWLEIYAQSLELAKTPLPGTKSAPSEHQVGTKSELNDAAPANEPEWIGWLDNAAGLGGSIHHALFESQAGMELHGEDILEIRKYYASEEGRERLKTFDPNAPVKDLVAAMRLAALGWEVKPRVSAEKQPNRPEAKAAPELDETKPYAPFLKTWRKAFNKGFDKLPMSLSGDLGQASAEVQRMGRENPEDAFAAAKALREDAELLSETKGVRLHPDRIKAIANEIERSAKYALDEQERKQARDEKKKKKPGSRFRDEAHAQELRQVAQDQLDTLKSQGRQPKQNLLNIVADADAFLTEGSKPGEGGIAGAQVFGHPLATNLNWLEYGYLIPIRASSRKSIEGRIDRAQALFDKVAQEIGIIEHMAKNKDKKAKAEMKTQKFDQKKVIRDLLHDETLPELTRLLAQFPSEEGEGTKSAPSEHQVGTKSEANEGGQRRAKPGGEYGENGEWYEGGKFIANTDKPKSPKPKSTPTGKAEVDNGVWVQRPKAAEGAFLHPLYGSLSALALRNSDGSLRLNPDITGNSYGTVEERQKRIDRWNEGARWVELDAETRITTGRYFDIDGKLFGTKSGPSEDQVGTKSEVPEIPEGVQVDHEGKPFSKEDADEWVEEWARMDQKAEVVPLGGGNFGVRKLGKHNEEEILRRDRDFAARHGWREARHEERQAAKKAWESAYHVDRVEWAYNAGMMDKDPENEVSKGLQLDIAKRVAKKEKWSDLASRNDLALYHAQMQAAKTEAPDATGPESPKTLWEKFSKEERKAWLMATGWKHGTQDDLTVTGGRLIKQGWDDILPFTRDLLRRTVPVRLTEEGRKPDGTALKPGEVFLTVSGRLTTPFPKQHKRQDKANERRVNQWSIDNYKAEADAKGDQHNATLAKALDADNYTQADGEGVNLYLFGEQAPVPKEVLKPLEGRPPGEDLHATRARLKNSILEGTTILKGKMPDEKRRLIERQVAKEKARVAEIDAELGEPEPVVTGTQKDAEVTVPMPQAEEDTLTPKEQKKYLMEEIDAAIEAAPDWKPPKKRHFTKSQKEEKAAYEKQQQEKVKALGNVTIEVPGDGVFNIFNSKYHLRAFKKKAAKFPTVADVHKKVSTPSSRRRLKDFVGDYYNPFRVRKRGAVGPFNKTVAYNDEFYSNGAYLIRFKKKPTIKPAWKREPFPDGLERTVAHTPEAWTKATILAETFQATDPDALDHLKPTAHIVSDDGKHNFYDARYLDHILTVWPDAETYVTGGALYFSDGTQVVGLAMPFRGGNLGTDMATDELPQYVKNGMWQLEQQSKLPEHIPGLKSREQMDREALRKPKEPEPSKPPAPKTPTKPSKFSRPKERFIVVSKDLRWNQWEIEATTDNIVEYAKLEGPDFKKFYDFDEDRWVEPGKKGPIKAKWAREQFGEVPTEAELETLLNPVHHTKTVAERKAEVEAQDDTWDDYFRDEHRRHVIHAKILHKPYYEGAEHNYIELGTGIYRDVSQEDYEKARYGDTPRASESPAPQTASKPRKKTKKAKPSDKKIESFGEKLGGSRKDAYAALLGNLIDADAQGVPFAKAFPQPNYAKLLADGTDPAVVALIRAMRDEIPTKPQRRGYRMQDYVTAVETARKYAADLLAGDMDIADARGEVSGHASLKPARGRADLYERYGHDHSLKGITLANHHYAVYRGEKDVTKWTVEKKSRANSAWSHWNETLADGDTKEEAIAAFATHHASLGGKKQTSGGKVKFDLYTRRNKPGRTFIGKKMGKRYLDLKDFPSSAVAREYLAENYDALEEALKKAKYIPDERRRSNEERIGEDHRKGKDATEEMFTEAFGFRGVDFGNWVASPGERQNALNNAFDALHDLAAIVKVPTQALSLHGKLGLGFGSHGRGGKNAGAAHFDPVNLVINLTRKKGAGSLAHEWWHGLDNYFSRMRGKTLDHVTDDTHYQTDASGYPLDSGDVRGHMLEAFDRVMKAIKGTGMAERSEILDTKRTKDYWSTNVEMSARAFENYVIAKLGDKKHLNDYLSNIVGESLFGEGYPYLRDAEMPEVTRAFDNFFDTLIYEREKDGKVRLYSLAELGFFSTVEKALTRMNFKIMPPADLLQRLKKTAGVKAEELEDLGLEPWLAEQKGKVSKADVLAFVKAGGPELEETTYTDNKVWRFSNTASEWELYETQEEAQAAYDAEQNWIDEEAVAVHRDEAEEWVEVTDAYGNSHFYAELVTDDGEPYWHYRNGDNEEYMGAGGDGFDDMVDRAEDMADDQREYWRDQVSPPEVDENHVSLNTTGYDEYQTPGGENYREVLLKLPMSRAAHEPGAQKAADFLGVPLDQVSVQALMDAHAPQGHIDAFSNWMFPAMGGWRDYSSSHWDGNANVLVHFRVNDREIGGRKVLFAEEVQSDWHQDGRKKGYKEPGKSLREELDAVESDLRKALADEDFWGFDTSWEAMRAINTHADFAERWETSIETEALAHRYRRLFAGQERYSDKVPNAPFKKSWHMLALKRLLRMAAENGYHGVAWTPGEMQAERYNLSKRVSKIVWSEDKAVLGVQLSEREGHKEPGVTREKLPEYVGKEAAEKLIAAPKYSGWQAIEGDDLKFGGHGMKAFYDKILKNDIQKYARKLDKYARVAIQEMGDHKVWMVPISETLRGKVLEGQSLYSKDDAQGSGVTKAELEALPMVTQVTGKDGAYTLHFKGGVTVPLATIQAQGTDGFLITPKGQKLLKRGWYDGKGITITQHGDKHTVSHELFHFMEDTGLITGTDKAILNRAARQAEGKLETSELAEARARFVEQAMRDREAHRATKIGGILQKIADFIDQLVNVFKRTVRGVVRDFERGATAPEPTTGLVPTSPDEGRREEIGDTGGPAVQYSLSREDVAEAQDAAKEALASAGSLLKEMTTKKWRDGFWEDLTAQSISNDTSRVSRLFSQVASYSRKIPAYWRAYRAAEGKTDDSSAIEYDITHLDGTDMFKALTKFKKAHRKAAKALSAYLNERDIWRKGYQVRPHKGKEGVYYLSGPKGKAIRDAKGRVVNHESRDPESLWAIARELEAEEYRLSTGDANASQALFYLRKTIDQEFALKYQDLKEYVDFLIANDLPVETAYQLDGDEIKIDLKLALQQLNEIRGYYMPRIWAEGEVNVYATKDGDHYNLMETFPSQLAADRRARVLRSEGYTVRVAMSSRPAEEFYQTLASTSAQESMAQRVLEKIRGKEKKMSFQTFDLHGHWIGDDKAFTVRGVTDHQTRELFRRFGGVEKEHRTEGWRIEWHFNGATKESVAAMEKELVALKSTEIPSALATSRAFVHEYARILKARGALQSRIQRSPAVGYEVYTGFEEDAVTRVAQAVRRTANGKAKQIMAGKMLSAINGHDVTWEQFKEIKRHEGTFEEWENADDGIDRATYDEIKTHWVPEPNYVDYQEFVSLRKIDPVGQKTAYTDAMQFFKHMLRNDELGDRVVRFLKGLAVIKYLGLRPAAVVVNVTNLAAAVPAVIYAKTKASPKKIPGLIRDGVTQYVRYKTGKGEVSAENRKIFAYIERHGWDASHQNSEALGAILSTKQRTYNYILDTSMKFFGWSESMNRGATIYAAYKALGDKGTFKERMEQAHLVSNDAHGVYTKANRPAIMRGGHPGANVLQMAYTFRTFAHNYMISMLRLGFKEKEAKAATYMALAPAIFGATSAVGVKALINGVGLALGSDDPEEDFYRVIADNFGAMPAKVVRFGLPGMVGVDLTGNLRIGLADLPTDGRGFLGAPGDVVISGWEGLQDMGHGNIRKGFERIVPAAIGNMSKALREYSEGVTTRSNAPVFYKDEPLRNDVIDGFLRFFSFNPARISQARAELWSERKRTYRHRDARREIYDRIRKFQGTHNPKRSDWLHIVALVQRYNEDAPEGEKRIDLKREAKRIAKQRSKP